MREVIGGLSAVRPVLEERQVTDLTNRVMSMTSADTVMIFVTHTARSVTRIARNDVRSSDNGEELEVAIVTKYGHRASVITSTNQLSDSTLRAVIQRCEALARDQIEAGPPVPTGPQQPDKYLPVNLWHNSTIDGMSTAGELAVPDIVSGVTKHGLQAAGFVGLVARVKAIVTKEGISAYAEETDSEVTITARTQDGKSAGWAGQAARDWSTIDFRKVAEDAAQMALRSRGAQALEPGRRTAILGPAAVAQIARYFALEFDAFYTDMGSTAFSKPSGRGNKLGERMFDPRIRMISDPQDKDGGYMPFFYIGHGTPKMTWVDNGVLKNLAYPPEYAVNKGKPYADLPYSLRIEAPNATTMTIEEMISRCEEGIYVNRFSDVNMMNMKTGMMTGSTGGGCFYIKNGRIDRPVRNFRILDSPFFFMNNIEFIGKPERAAFGYAPPGSYEPVDLLPWPRSPMIVPPMMVRDFNFSALSDAV